MKKVKFLYFSIVLTILIGCLWYAKPYLEDYTRTKEVNKEVKSLKGDKKEYINFKKLHKINPDIIAWIKIPKTTIDYPIVRTKDNNYYLYHNVKKQKSQYGALFFDQRAYENPLKEKNVIVYGHNFGSYTDIMFSKLNRYLVPKYLEQHKKVCLYTKNGCYEYNVIDAKEVYSTSDAFKMDFLDGSYDEWLNTINKLQNREIKQILTLATCNNTGAKRVVVRCYISDEGK